MSRSYRKNPILTDNNSSKKYKRIANRKVRAALKTPTYIHDGLGLTDYKKLSESWEIRDWSVRYSPLEAERAGINWADYKRLWLSK